MLKIAAKIYKRELSNLSSKLCFNRYVVQYFLRDCHKTHHICWCGIFFRYKFSYNCLLLPRCYLQSYIISFILSATQIFSLN